MSAAYWRRTISYNAARREITIERRSARGLTRRVYSTGPQTLARVWRIRFLIEDNDWRVRADTWGWTVAL